MQQISVSTQHWGTVAWTRRARTCAALGLWASASAWVAAGQGGPGSKPTPASLERTAAAAVHNTAGPTIDIAARLAGADCKALRLDPAPLIALQHILQPMGLGLRILGCPEAPAPLHQRVLAVTAVVLDGDKAVGTVRGALGDGEPVDMGGHYQPVPWPQRHRAADLESVDDAEFSPDVQFNRRWLRTVMASQGYASVTGPWWAFIPVPGPRKR